MIQHVLGRTNVTKYIYKYILFISKTIKRIMAQDTLTGSQLIEKNQPGHVLQA